MPKRKLNTNVERDQQNKKRKKDEENVSTEVSNKKVWFGFECPHCPKNLEQDDDSVRKIKYLQRLVLCPEVTYNKTNKGLSL